MSINAADKKEISKMITDQINEALDFVEDDQQDQDRWMRIQISKIHKSINALKNAVSTLQNTVSTLQNTVSTLQTNSKWQISLLIALLTVILGTALAVIITLITSQ